MNVLILGAGGREHALAWKIKQSTALKKLFVAPGNAGTNEIANNIDLDVDDFQGIGELVIKESIDIVVVGPEAPLVKGIKDYFQKDNRLKTVAVFGPGKQGAMLEGSKDWAKTFMERYQIPTASHRTFSKNELEKAFAYLNSIKAPYVLKADGLAAGKGVVICETIQQAQDELTEMLEKSKFGEASEKVVIEEFLSGMELSVFVITDGKHYKLLPAAKDYKRIGEGDTGLNTGGMGAISPVPFAGDDFMKKVEDQIIKPTISGLQKEQIGYTGFIFFGLMKVENNPFVIEYNVRMGDPEAESIIPRIESDLLDLLHAATNETLSEKSLKMDPRYSASVMLASGGYPGKYEKGKSINGMADVENAFIFHAGTKHNQTIETSGGRVLAITGMALSLEEALQKAYYGCEAINFEGKYFRKDLGQDLMKYLNR